MAIDWTTTPINSIGFLSTDFIAGLDGDARNLSTASESFATMSLMAQNQFKWKTLLEIEPFERLTEYIEALLYWFGQCCIVDEGGLKVKKCLPVGNVGAFGHPDKFKTCDYDGSNTKVYSYSEIIWIKNNAACIPTIWFLSKYCDRIAHIERVMDLNIDAQKTPYIIESTPEMQHSVKNIFHKIKTMAECVFLNANKGGIRDKVKVLNLNAPYLVDKLYTQKQNEINDALNLLGINTIDEKRERLVVGETEVSEEITENYLNMFYSSRLIAVKQFNKKFGAGALACKMMKLMPVTEGGAQREQLHDSPEEPA